jgi:hypothetical protein
MPEEYTDQRYKLPPKRHKEITPRAEALGVMSDARPRDGATARLSGDLRLDLYRPGDQKPAEILVKAQSA